MSAVVINSGLVHYEAFGRGRPVLFLHGWLGSWRYWMRTMESLADKHRTYALDLWGFGDSDKSKPRYTVADHVELVDSFISNLGINEMPIVGHALGAAVALEYAARYPGRVKKVVAVSLPMSSDTISRRLMDLASQSVMSKIMWWRQIEHKEVQQEVEKAGDGAITTSVQSFDTINVPERMASISQMRDSMMLAVYGERDDIVDPAPVRSLNHGWDNIRPIGLADSRHFPMLDEAAKFNRLLKDFLEIESGNLADLELKEEWRRRTR